MKPELLAKLRNTRVKYMKQLITPNQLRAKVEATDEMGEMALVAEQLDSQKHNSAKTPVFK